MENQEKKYTNQESVWASKMAYIQITNALLDRVRLTYSVTDPTFAQICEYCNDNEVNLCENDGDGSKENFVANASFYEYGEWKIVGVCDNNGDNGGDGDGLYAIAIETGEYTQNGVENGVILAVRGSEAHENQFMLDWLLTDMNIVNSDLTSQEQTLNKFIDEEFAPLVQAKGYQNVAGMGHSLGGYLCFEGLAHIAATNPFLYDLLMQGVSIDGPNPPDENISANQSAYDMIKDFCYHYQYSMVGCIFEDNCICNDDHRLSIKEASNWQYNPVDFGVSMGASYELLGPQAQFFIQYLFGCVSRHNLPSLCFTEDGEFDYTASDRYNCPPDLFGNDEDISWYRINGLQTLFYCVNSILYSIENHTDAGTVAEIVSKITQSADKSNLPQIMFGSLIETITEEYNFFVKSNVSDDIKVAIEDLSLDTQLLSEVMYDYFTFVLPASSNQVDMVISPNETINKWFDFLSDINEFGQSFVQHAKGDYYNVADDVLKMDCIETMNIIECAAELSKELLVSSERIIQSTVLAGTQEIIASVTNWDSYNKYINAQIELSSNWQDNISEISSNIAQISTFDDDLEDSLNTYKIASLKFLTASVAAFANSNSVTGISTNILSNISALRQDMTRATNQLLSKTKLVSLNTEQLFRNVAILIKQGIEDSFQYIYAWGELKISDAIVDLASDYYEYVNELNISGVVDNWTLIAKKHNGATDVVYKVSDGGYLYGTDALDVLNGSRGDDNIIGYKGDDVIYGHAGNDTIDGGDGNDTIYGGSGSDSITGKAGNDIIYGEYGNDVIYGGTGDDQLFGGDGSDAIYGESGNDNIEGGLGNDVIYAGGGNDSINGGMGEDSIYGDDGNDQINGGSGNDRLEGSAGSDKYFFNIGDGVDVIYDYEWNFGNIDKISFGSGIRSEDVRMERRGNDLYVWYSKNDHLIVQDSYRNNGGTGRYFVENVEFADGTVWDTEEIANRANKIMGTNGDDTLWGFGEAVGYHHGETFRTGAGNDIVYAGEGADTIYGESGNDQLYGENGNDTLIGGKGSDRLEGGSGSDKYVFNLGDGADVIYDYEWNLGNVDKISFESVISSEDVRMERRGNDLYVWYSKNDHLIVQDSYRNNGGTGRYFVENVEFADGTVWDTEEIANRANKIMGSNGDDTLWGFGEAVGYHQGETFKTGAGNDIVYAGEGADTIYGESGNDQLYGENGNDTLIGGSGNDRLEGSAGSDKYFFNIGDGVDVIYDYEWNFGNVDKISFESVISSEDVRMERRGNDLYMWYSPKDYLIVQDSYRNNGGTGRYFVENVEFADGTVWDTEEIANRANKILGTSGDDALWGFGEAVGYHQGETFRTGAGNDIVYAGEGADTIYGESGNDQLYGENGNDTLIGGKGSDRLEGGSGSDKYVFNLGDGADVIYDYEWNFGNIDKISFGDNITPDNVRMERRGNDLYVWYSKNDHLIVQDSYRNNGGTGRYFVENVEFADGTVWDTEEIANRANKIMGSNGDDTLWGFGEAVGYHQSETFRTGAGNDIVYAGEGADTIYGESGNDQLYGENGNDTLIGGSGNDRLEGSAGSDKYFFNIGDGVDVIYDYEWNFGNIDKISFGDNITPDNVRMERRGNDLYVWYSKNDHLIVQDSYRNNGGTGRYFVENVEFADGTVWDTEEIANRANKIMGSNGDDTLWGFGEAVGYHQGETFRTGAGNDIVYAGEGADTIYGESGNDQLYGENGNDTLIGGSGNDRLEGSAGSDKYFFNIGDGVDVIYDYEWNFGNIDKISFGDNITPDDVRMERRGNDLYVWYSPKD